MWQRAFASLFFGSLVLGTSTVMAEDVTGAVTDSAKTVNFEGALVRIDGIDASATTDQRGRFQLTDVPAGNHTLVISYLGTGNTSIEIIVPDGGLQMGDVAIGGDSGSLEEVIVYGQAAAIASALNQERAADNVVSVLDTDAMGQFPDQNVAESLRRLSGVTVENDQGEGRYVVIRGMDPDLNSTSINGVRTAAAEPRNALQLDVIPSDVLDGMEISKTLTPDMDGDAIGGAINIKTLSAFSRKGPYMKARVESAYNEIREEWSPKASIAGSNIFDLSSGKRLGVAAALSWNDRELQVDNLEVSGWDAADNGSDFMDEFQPRLYTVDRERLGGVLNFDLDVSDSTSLFLYSLYSRLEDTELRNRFTAALDGDDLDQATVTDDFAEFGFAELERDTKDRDQIAENLTISFGSKTQLDTWNVDTLFGYAYGRERTPDQVEATWVAEFESGVGPITAGSPVLAIDSSNAQVPVLISAFESSLYDATLYELDEIENVNEKNEDTILSFQLDAGRDTNFGSVKFGVKARMREKKTNEEVEFWSNDDTWFLSDVPNPGAGDVYGLPQEMNPVPNASGIRDILASGVGLEFEAFDSALDSNVSDFVFDEDIIAVYGMGRWDRGPLVITAGARVEFTDLDSKGSITDVIEEDANGPGDPPEDQLIITPVSATNSYSDFLPSINVRYEYSEKMIGRVSMHRSVVRPRAEEIAFRVEVDGDEAEIGNPDLDPFRAWNIDASLSFYPTDLSVLSAGVFYKEIEDFIFVQVLEDFDFGGRIFDEATIAQNGEDATVLGIELNYQQHFGFLGAPWDAFIIGLNFTYVDTEAETDGRKVDLPLQSKTIASFLLGYDKHNVDIRLAMKYRDKAIHELDGPGDDRYIDEHLQWDLTAKYRINDSWQIYAEIANLDDEPEYYYQGRKNRSLQYDDIGTTSAIGVQYNFQ